jgi:hypothetical protein
MYGRGLLGAIAPLMMLGALLLLLAVQHGLFAKASPAAAPWPIPPPTTATVDVGVTTGPLAQNAWREWRPSDLGTINAFEHAARKHASIVMWYADWEHNTASVAQLRAVAERGSLPEITWEPWDASKGLWVSQPRYALRNILAGKFDPYIRSWAVALAAWRRPVWLRFAQEMNGSWYPWDERANGNHRGEFVRVWRHVHDIFAAAGAGNVRWVWSPVLGAPRAYFPGPNYVDVLGVTCLNGGVGLSQKGWRSFAAICGGSIEPLHAFAPRLPIEIPELATTEVGGSKPAWIEDMFAFIAKHPAVQSIVWFDIRKESDWRIESSQAAIRAFTAAVSAPRYK